MSSSASEPDVIELSSVDESEDRSGSDSDKRDTARRLCKDLESALREDKLETPGSYAYSSLLPVVPLACPNVEGLGNIGLPISETDAKRLIACASQAPFGQGSQTIVDKKVRDTWEIDPARVKFENPNWVTYVQDLAVRTVCTGLGLKDFDTPPRCELYKLLIYETGSRFRAHRDTQKADGMFATMIILLPSQYTGGEIHLTHASKTQIVDFSTSSLTNTAVLAWYTDVLHEVKPVTSGYRVALSYNLIHTSPRTALPVPPPSDGGPCAELRRVLHNWKKRKYENSDHCNHIAYLLQHQYSAIDFGRGASCLKGEDNHRIALIRAAAEGLGFTIFLASLDYHVSGYSDDDYGYSWPSRCAYDSELDDMEKEVDVTLSKMADLDGNPVLASDSGRSTSIGIDKDYFLPRHVLDDESPDGMDESGYTGNEGATVDYWYKRSVFVVMLSDHLPRILLRNGGMGYVMKLFKESLSDNGPTKKDKDMAKLIISNLDTTDRDRASVTKDMLDYAHKWKDIEMWQELCHVLVKCGEIGHVMKLFKESLSDNSPTARDKNIATLIISNLRREKNDRASIMKEMFDYAYKWEDINMWQDLIESCGGKVEVQGENGLIRAWQVFKFDQTRAKIERWLHIKPLSDKLTFINAIRQAGSKSGEKDTIREWCSSQTTAALKTYVSPDVRDVPMLVSMACKNGIQSIYQIPIKKFGRALQFLAPLLRDLHAKRTVVLEKTVVRYSGSNDPQSEAASMLDKFMKNCLDCAEKQWNVVISGSRSVGWNYPTSYQHEVNEASIIVELCLLTRQMDTCLGFLNRVWNVSGEFVDKSNRFYMPLVPELCKVLQKSNTDVCVPPFIDFFRLIISYHLCYVLGMKEQGARPIRKIGCGCHDCQQLNGFIAGNGSQYTFRMAQPRRTHLEKQMITAQDLVTYQTIRQGSPHSLVVTKTPGAIAGSAWECRLKVINSMFKAIGEKNVEKIMGDRFADVCKAVRGQAAFHLDKTVVHGSASTSTAKATTSGTEKKRKRESAR